MIVDGDHPLKLGKTELLSRALTFCAEFTPFERRHAVMELFMLSEKEADQLCRAFRLDPSEQA